MAIHHLEGQLPDPTPPTDRSHAFKFTATGHEIGEGGAIMPTDFPQLDKSEFIELSSGKKIMIRDKDGHITVAGFYKEMAERGIDMNDESPWDKNFRKAGRERMAADKDHTHNGPSYNREAERQEVAAGEDGRHGAATRCAMDNTILALAKFVDVVGGIVGGVEETLREQQIDYSSDDELVGEVHEEAKELVERVLEFKQKVKQIRKW